MKVVLIGLAQSGKSEVFRSLGGQPSGETFEFSTHVANIKVPDERLTRLGEIFKPPKIVYADIDIMDITGGAPEQKGVALSTQVINEIRTADALIVVVGAFENPSVAHPLNSIDPLRDTKNIEAELTLNDLMQVEKRMQRMEKERSSALEKDLLLQVKAALDEEKPLRLLELSAAEQTILRGFNFLSHKPALLLLNVSEADIGKNVYAEIDEFAAGNGCPVMRYCADIEREISELEPAEQEEFLAELALEKPGRERFIREMYRLLRLISFFTAGETEVHAWSVPVGINALNAAGKIHSDIERGFIRAEMIDFETFIAVGSMQAAKGAGQLRLEGKEYRVADGDIITFRFHV
jgi:hypothetical protein